MEEEELEKAQVLVLVKGLDLVQGKVEERVGESIAQDLGLFCHNLSNKLNRNIRQMPCELKFRVLSGLKPLCLLKALLPKFASPSHSTECSDLMKKR